MARSRRGLESRGWWDGGGLSSAPAPGASKAGLGALRAAPRSSGRCLYPSLPTSNAGRGEEPALTICCEAPPPRASASQPGGLPAEEVASMRGALGPRRPLSVAQRAEGPRRCPPLQPPSPQARRCLPPSPRCPSLPTAAVRSPHLFPCRVGASPQCPAMAVG